MRRSRANEELRKMLDGTMSMVIEGRRINFAVADSTPKRVYSKKRKMGYQVAYSLTDGQSETGMAPTWTLYSTAIEDEKHLGEIFEMIKKQYPPTVKVICSDDDTTKVDTAPTALDMITYLQGLISKGEAITAGAITQSLDEATARAATSKASCYFDEKVPATELAYDAARGNKPQEKATPPRNPVPTKRPDNLYNRPLPSGSFLDMEW